MYHFLTTGFLTFLGLDLDLVQTSLGTSTHSSVGSSLGTSLVTCLQVLWGSRVHCSLGASCIPQWAPAWEQAWSHACRSSGAPGYTAPWGHPAQRSGPCRSTPRHQEQSHSLRGHRAPWAPWCNR